MAVHVCKQTRFEGLCNSYLAFLWVIPGLVSEEDNSKALLHGIYSHEERNWPNNNAASQSWRQLHRVKMRRRARADKAQAHK